MYNKIPLAIVLSNSVLSNSVLSNSVLSNSVLSNTCVFVEMIVL